MSKLLSIAIPTYNRAEMLDTQLQWLSKNLAGIESDCNIFINDNCSTDDTAQVIRKWSQKFRDLGIEFSSNRHPSNIGGMANIEATMRSGTGDYVWTLGDDDKIKDGTARYIIELLKKNKELSMLLLDGVGVDQITGEIKYDCLFKYGTEKPFTGPS
jgi:glycosyltransferase involved in cell wall biosynthesis